MYDVRASGCFSRFFHVVSVKYCSSMFSSGNKIICVRMGYWIAEVYFVWHSRIVSNPLFQTLSRFIVELKDFMIFSVFPSNLSRHWRAWNFCVCITSGAYNVHYFSLSLVGCIEFHLGRRDAIHRRQTYMFLLNKNVFILRRKWRPPEAILSNFFLMRPSVLRTHTSTEEKNSKPKNIIW